VTAWHAPERISDAPSSAGEIASNFAPGRGVTRVLASAHARRAEHAARAGIVAGR